ncbi:CbiX/SirB N-terminal domain-containing protein [Sulfurimonas sp.]|uniref:sirohydrochlorin chelatase n=1 Tax=Sulfurimonas sp. TaxID=2022749 RepID=UPI0025F1895D|nr:CbiX/SirB N-terminal domain-containing protein [Sulfurimonas sp.]MBT5934045.1 CbiX/SirB N-terminal domain-containing protein [Sulfurimonas sp.]
MDKKIGIILVAHGSKHKKSNDEFIQLCDSIRVENLDKFDFIEHAFLEFEEPTIEMAIKSVHERSIDNVSVYPYFLNSGKHVSVDLPFIISEVETLYPSMKIELLNHFGSSKSILSIISSDLEAVL